MGNHMVLQTKILLLCNVLSVLFYGLKSWIMIKATIIKIEVFEMCLHRGILKIFCTNHVINIEVFRRMTKKKEIFNTVKIRKLHYSVHMIWNESRFPLLQSILYSYIFQTLLFQVFVCRSFFILISNICKPKFTPFLSFLIYFL